MFFQIIKLLKKGAKTYKAEAGKITVWQNYKKEL